MRLTEDPDRLSSESRDLQKIEENLEKEVLGLFDLVVVVEGSVEAFEFVVFGDRAGSQGVAIGGGASSGVTRVGGSGIGGGCGPWRSGGGRVGLCRRARRRGKGGGSGGGGGGGGGGDGGEKIGGVGFGKLG
ncbi:glycine-rich cell wall structural protein-like [Camellia sinensis]|uniref:glycine-rich cell wall structural protein-like n=1 Tax=Camellia sinensis TaxID=4442 RepID=UPI00103593B1|nr:glycine-rich cell wall structural protein-like [Camellia sinensis]